MHDKKQDQYATKQLPATGGQTQINISVIGDINFDTVVLPSPKGNKSEDKIPGLTGTDKVDETHDTNYLRFSNAGGALLLANSIYSSFGNSTKIFRIFTYKAELKKQEWKELQITLYLYPKESFEKRDRESKVYRMDRVPGFIHDNYIPSDTDVDRDNLVKRYSKLLSDLHLLFPTTTHEKSATTEPTNNSRIVVIHERNLGFRFLTKEALETIIPPKNEHPLCVVLSIDNPLSSLVQEKGHLWEFIKERREHSVIIVDAVSLRQAGINIRESASIEQTIRNFFFHLEKSELLKELCMCRHLLVHFTDGGVLHYETNAKCGDNKAMDGVTFHFCPFFESDAANYSRDFGSMIGYRTILASAITKGIAFALHSGKDIADGIYYGTRLGVLLGKHHFRNGFEGSEKLLEEISQETNQVKNFNFLESKFKKLIGNFATSDSVFAKELNDCLQSNKSKEEKTCRNSSVASLQLPRSYDELANWSRVYSLREHFGDNQTEFEKALCKIVREGLDKVVIAPPSKEEGKRPAEMWFPSAQVLCPYVQFGSIKTADRAEIDSLIGITAIIRKYLGNKDWKMPLSIAIFGPPGSGKGFTIKQILKSLNPSVGTSTLEYNVAQFVNVKNLTTAFHQAQDKALSEEVPLIIFDEFDANFEGHLGWLKYFLAPMQDGKFKGDDGTFQVGRAIFVFAGGTSYTFEDFCKDPEKDSEFKNAKGPDFISRLRGYLNIGDINPKEKATEISDILMFRRAIVLRSILEVKAAGTIFDPDTKEMRIDDKVTNAFLRIMKYKHGVRSMEAIIEMSNLEKEEGGFLVASLPPPDQLQMHVSANEFLNCLGH